MSFHDPDSDVSRLNREAWVRPVQVDASTFEVLKAAVEMQRRSHGIFDVGVAPILQAKGILPRTDADVAIGTKARVFDAIELLDANTISFRDSDVRIDLGGIAKGFAVDRALETLRQLGVASGIVNAGGDLACFGPKIHAVRIRDPRDPGRLICDVEVANEALASTARRFDIFRSRDTARSAVIDPRSEMPAALVDGVTVRAPTCMIADALTKIVMITGTDAAGLLEQYNASALLMASDGDVRITPDWQHAVHLAA